MRWWLNLLICLSLAASPVLAVENPQSGSAAVTATVPDRGRPDTPVLISPDNNSTVGTAAPTFIFNPSLGDRPVSHYQLWIDGAKNTDHIPHSFSTITANALTALNEGSHTWMIKAIATNGSDRDSAIWSFTVDTTAPFLLIETAAGQEFSRGPVFTTTGRYPEISGQTEAGATVTISFGEQTVSAAAGLDRTFSLKPKTALALGRHAVYVSAADEAGNSTSLPAFYLNIITAPAGIITIPLPPPLPDLSFTVPLIVPAGLPQLPTLFPVSPACPKPFVVWGWLWLIILLLIAYIIHLNYKLKRQKISNDNN